MYCMVQGLLGGLSNVLETLRGEGAPPPACRAVVHASLRYIDAELLNALMLRRDACSISAVKALQVCCSTLSLCPPHVQCTDCAPTPGRVPRSPGGYSDASKFRLCSHWQFPNWH